MRLDHLAIACTDLDDGAAWVEARLGVPMQAGGRHALMGTHNRLLSLGDLYLEVIAIDPDAAPPDRARWFGLDRFTGPPRLTNWILACDDLEAECARGPAGIGAPLDLARGAYRWRMAVPQVGILPFDNTFPALIEWRGAAHPAQALTDRGVRLTHLTVTHPDAPDMADALAGRLDDPRVTIRRGTVPSITATFTTPNGTCQL